MLWGPQNLLLVALDYLGLSSAMRVVCMGIARVQTGVHWLPDAGDMGIANISLVTMSEDPDSLAGNVRSLALHVICQQGWWGPQWSPHCAFARPWLDSCTVHTHDKVHGSSLVKLLRRTLRLSHDHVLPGLAHCSH